MKKTFLVTIDSELDDQQLIEFIDNALLFRVEEAVDDIFRGADGKKNYREFNYRIRRIRELAVWLSKNSVEFDDLKGWKDLLNGFQ